ncbi:putative late blight resistance protein homolog R1B-17 [Coffea eugenioides]|uniref:putative late blight resistance protein homolog R1B-17 n=1 Tax=Coffea eugenioides TaxID=49369 RepID=UPI000F608AE3|nr:putative late blight resistance protein homolog R1B-17 [Coffea eugenioides]
MVIEIVFNQFKEITEDERLTLTCIEELASGVTSLCNSFPADEITEEAMNKMGLWLFDLLERVQTLQAKLKELYLQVPMLNFPKTPALGFIEFLQQKLKQLLKWNPDSVAHLTNRIETISEDFEFLISHLIDFKEKGVENHGRKELCTRLIHVAHEAEYAIDSLVVKSGDEWNQFLWLYHISEEIRLIKMQVRPFQGKAIAVGVQNAVQTTRHEIPRTRATGTSEDVLILNDQQKEIVNLLKRESTHRDVISIVGMPGIGKTTLANQVYNDPEIVGSFHIRAWCYVSQVYTKRDLLLEILSHNQPNDKIHAMEDEDLELLLYQSLRRNRYLIFLDDVWDIGVWDNLQRSFPNDQNGSKILITSRLSDVVSKVTPESDLVKLRPLSDDESWELLRMKIFPEKRCPEKLREVGREIAEKCQGLPLSVVAIASLLKGRKMKPESWKQIVRSLNPRIIDDPQTRCMEIFELSYKNLPDYLKACFLYLAVFQEDKEIPVQKLTWLWMAEGFIQEKNSKSLEDLAEDYLIDLIGRSLITVAKRRSDGGVKSCRLHHLVRALCLLKAKKENFLEFITSDDKPYASFDDDLDLEEFEPSYPMNYDGYRLSISTRRNHFVMSTPSGSYVRTLLFFATGDTYPRCPYDISFISRNFKLLKVLDLECINMGNLFAAGIDLLLHLIYLAVGGDIDCIPSSLANLRNLESFLVKGLKGKVILPDAIWHMARLRHVRVKDRLSFNLKDLQVGISTQLNNLVSLSSVSLSPGEHAEEIIRRLPNVRKLSCIILRSRNYSVECIEFPRFERLTELMALKISYRGKGLNVSAFDFPKSLKKLSLSNFFLRGYHISKIGSLSNLEVLKLRSIVFKHTNWRMIKGKFRQLKCLKLESVNIMKWKANSERLPSLQHLVLRRCENLKKVPVDFVKIETLQIIEVQGCRESVEISLRRLKEEERRQYGTDILKIAIQLGLVVSSCPIVSVEGQVYISIRRSFKAMIFYLYGEEKLAESQKIMEMNGQNLHQAVLVLVREDDGIIVKQLQKFPVTCKVSFYLFHLQLQPVCFLLSSALIGSDDVFLRKYYVENSALMILLPNGRILLAQKVWKLAPVQWDGIQTQTGCFKQWWAALTQARSRKEGKQHLALTANILWQLWKDRNQLEFEGKEKDGLKVVQKASIEWMEFEEAGTGKEDRSTSETVAAHATQREEGMEVRDLVELHIATQKATEGHKMGIGVVAKLNGTRIIADWALVDRTSTGNTR